MRLNPIRPYTSIFFLFVSFFCFAQSNRLFLPLDETGKTYIKASLRTQFWARYMQTNPGTTINGEPVDESVDFSFRRVRIGLSSQVTPRLYVYSLWGNNNINETGEKDFIIDLLDYTVEYEFHKAFTFGFGESAWGGPSRWTVRSSKSLMALDAPLFTLFTVNKNDDLARLLGIYAKGQVGKFDYVLAMKDPANYSDELINLGDIGFADNNAGFQYSGYLKYEFIDNESNKTAYSGGTGTYLGKKSILNLGGGLLYQKNMMSSIQSDGMQYHDFKNWAAEVFYDAPTRRNNGSAVTTYFGFFSTDYGPNYVRNLGANDITAGGTSYNGSGVDFPMMGTGNTLFYQFGYLMKKGMFGNEAHESIQLQPNIAIQYSEFEVLDDPVFVLDLGVNAYFRGHDNKLTIGYQNRPVFEEQVFGQIKLEDRKAYVVMQYQITIN